MTKKLLEHTTNVWCPVIRRSCQFATYQIHSDSRWTGTFCGFVSGAENRTAHMTRCPDGKRPREESAE